MKKIAYFLLYLIVAFTLLILIQGCNQKFYDGTKKRTPITR